MAEDKVYYAVEEALSQFSDWDKDGAKIKKQVRNYFNKGAKSIAFQASPWYDVINEYADNAFASIFRTFGEEDWLKDGTVDFLKCLDAGIQDNFPPQMLARVDINQYQGAVTAAYSRAWDENLVWPMVDDKVKEVTEGPKTKKKVYAAVEQGWKDAYTNALGDLEMFLRTWIDRSLFHLGSAAENNGGLQYVLPQSGAMKLFTDVIYAGGIPCKFMASSQPPPGWFVGTCLKEGYTHYSTPEEDWGPPAKGGKGGGKGKGKDKGKEKRPPNPIFADVPEGACRKYCVDKCIAGDACKFVHDDNAKWSVDSKIAEQEAAKAAEAAEAEASGEGAAEEGTEEWAEEPSAKKAKQEW